MTDSVGVFWLILFLRCYIKSSVIAKKFILKNKRSIFEAIPEAQGQAIYVSGIASEITCYFLREFPRNDVSF
jgi:hypothetical protein